jgi:hypothetical protein
MGNEVFQSTALQQKYKRLKFKENINTDKNPL